MAVQPGERMQVVRGNITQLQVDAIVNAANASLAPGGGVDGAIRRAAGPELDEACRQLGGCPPGEARITPGFRLPARYVIHTVGPIYHGGQLGEAQLLRSCYINSLRLALEKGIRSIAFPCISTGVYGYPKSEACVIAVTAVSEWLRDQELPERVIFCCFDEEDYILYKKQLQELSA
ncbi:MAG: O-acetyl-ADP-ribose deacetylase [Gemmatales bacterium]|nr:O-acetyl-ADP-ribose deacetylase [Gemmatales bacterium]MCS7160960.1 O-acetyl-ADP-ribose deacetylase [Gemmatales bacterium]MDW8176163.1 O-acetyl-ADP-ribose deacetylase [Gemmatales bacterium]MDW8223491.1 O-acetyl-ADP-ribose deacetylase [Gemmatales bacterium]